MWPEKIITDYFTLDKIYDLVVLFDVQWAQASLVILIAILLPIMSIIPARVRCTTGM